MFLIDAAIVFALGALGGLYMATLSFKGKPIPAAVAALHGLFGAAGLVLLIIGVVTGLGGGLAGIALIILLAAALGGFYLLSFHIKKQQHPRAVILIHGSIATIGLLMLLAAILQSQTPST